MASNVGFKIGVIGISIIYAVLTFYISTIPTNSNIEGWLQIIAMIGAITAFVCTTIYLVLLMRSRQPNRTGMGNDVNILHSSDDLLIIKHMDSNLGMQASNHGNTPTKKRKLK